MARSTPDAPNDASSDVASRNDVAHRSGDEILLAPEEVLESDRASLITGMAIARSWRDRTYRDRLRSAPKAVLRDEGLAVPDGMEVRVFFDTPEIRHVSLTGWTSEPEELAHLFDGLLPLPEGLEVRLVQNTERAICLIVPEAPAEPETLTDVEELRRLAPRASVYASAESLVSAVTTEFGNSGSASASATAHTNTETETATATAAASGLINSSGEVTVYTSPPPASGTVTGCSPPSATMTGGGSPTSATVIGPNIFSSASASASTSTSASTSSATSADTEVSTHTYEVTNANTFAEVDISVVSEGAAGTIGIELEAGVTTTTAAAEAEVVAVAAVVLT